MGIPKMDGLKGNSIYKWMIWGTPILGNPHMFCFICSHSNHPFEYDINKLTSSTCHVFRWSTISETATAGNTTRCASLLRPGPGGWRWCLEIFGKGMFAESHRILFWNLLVFFDDFFWCSRIIYSWSMISMGWFLNDDPRIHEIC